MLLSMMMNRKLKIGKNIYYLIFPRFHLVVLDYLFTFAINYIINEKVMKLFF